MNEQRKPWREARGIREHDEPARWAAVVAWQNAAKGKPMTRGFLNVDLPNPFEKPVERRNPRTGATIHRATVEVNGKRVDDIDRCKMIVVVPTGYDSAQVREMLKEAGYILRSEWIDGTGTLTIIAESE